jgi:hypothetical protein
VLPRRPPDAAVEAILNLHDRWSDALWEILDQRPGHPDPYAQRLAS